jgi:hypothetical protein
MAKPKYSTLGKHHADSIRRNSEVPKAARNFPNSTPGAVDKPVVHDKVTGEWKQK